jgi:CBS domain-containing protein
MAQRIEDVMTPNPVTLESSSPLGDAAKAMRENDIGQVIVMEDGRVCGVITDRDIVVRGLAEGADMSTPISRVCSADLVTVSPDDDVDEAVRMMRERAIRRLPVVRDGKPIGVVSLGDLAKEKDPKSALADISSAPANT